LAHLPSASSVNASNNSLRTSQRSTNVHRTTRVRPCHSVRTLPSAPRTCAGIVWTR
jgi:hypothetical protein